MKALEYLTDEELAFIAKEGQRLQKQFTRAQRAGTPATLTLREWFSIIEQFNGICALCKECPFQEMDHLIPVALGGGTTAENCIPTCKKCNNGKGRRTARYDEQQQCYIVNQLGDVVNHLPEHQKRQFAAPGREWITPKEFAAAVNLPRQKIYELMAMKHIKAQIPATNGYYLIHKSELTKYLASREELA